MFEQLGKFQEAEAVLRKMAEQQPERLERWLALVRHQAAHGGASAATKTIEDVKLRFKNDRPELLEAQCRTAAGDRPGADKAFEAAIRRYPDDRDVLLYAERYFEGMGRFDRAEACLKRLLERDPNDHPAARQLAILLSGRPESWAQALAVLGPEGPKNDTAEDRLARGVVLVRSTDAAQRKRGTDLLTALVADLPAENNVAIMARDVLVRLLLATGQAAQASQVAATSATTGSDPNAVALYVETLIQSGHYDVAEAQIDRLVKLGVSGQSEANLRVRLIQGRSLQERATPAKSAAALEQAYLARADTAEGEAYGREIFPMLVAMGPDAREVAERLARRLARKSPPLSWMPALILARQGNRDAALAFCRTAAQAGKDPADLREAGRIALEVSVAARLEASALERAGEVLDVALRNSPDFDDLLVMRAMVDHLQSRFDEEARLYRAVLSHQPEHPVVLNNLAWVLSEGLDQTREALDKIDLLIKLAGRRAENLDTRGVILSRMGRLDEAIKDLEEVARAEPTGVHFYHLAQAYRKAGRDAESRKAFEKARQAGLNAETLDPTERAAFEAMRSL
jgi:tetratricopeptide (TPR) repeat protein